MTPHRHRPWSTWARRCAGLALVSTDVGKVHARNAAHVEKIKSAVVTRWSRGGHTVGTRWSQRGVASAGAFPTVDECRTAHPRRRRPSSQPTSLARQARRIQPRVQHRQDRLWHRPVDDGGGCRARASPTVDEWRTAHPRRRRPSDQPISVAQNPQSPPWRRWDQLMDGRPARAHAGGTHEKGRARPALFHAGRR